MLLFGVTYMVYLVQKDLSVTRRFAGFLHRSNLAFSNVAHDTGLELTELNSAAGAQPDHRHHHIPGIHHHHNPTSNHGHAHGNAHGNVATTLNFTTPPKHLNNTTDAAVENGEISSSDVMVIVPGTDGIGDNANI